MDTLKMTDLTVRCNQLKRFSVRCSHLSSEAQLTIIDENRSTENISTSDTLAIIDQIRDIVRTKTDALEFQIKQLANNEKSS